MPETYDAAAGTVCTDRRIHILHGNRNSSKTTSMLQLIRRDLTGSSDAACAGDGSAAHAADDRLPFSCTAEEAVYENGKKIGYIHHVFSSSNPEGCRYAAVHRNRDDLYGGHISKWGRFFMSEDAFSEVKELLLKDLEKGVRLFLIDEVGKMELKGECGHYELLKQLLQRKETTLYITVRTQNLDEAKKFAEQFGRSAVSIPVERISDYE